MSKRGKLIIIVAPSGTGKSTLIKKLREKFPFLCWSVSTTTRSKRPTEVHGVDYFFTSTEEFKKGIQLNDFVEWANVHGNFYGTSKKFVEQGLSEGKIMLFDLDVQGTDAMLRVFPKDARVIFIAPPSLEILEKRLRERGTENEESIKRRTLNAVDEIKRKNDFEFLVINDNFDQALQDLSSVISQIMSGDF